MAVYGSLLPIVVLLLAPGAARASGTQIPVNTTPPSIAGTPKPGETLTASAGAWSGEPTEFKYRWERCDAAGGSCAWTYESEPNAHLVIPSEVGKTIRVRVTALNEAGESAPAFSAPVMVETAWRFVTGPPKVKVASWDVSRSSRAPRAKGKTLTIYVRSGFCRGEPPPVIDHVRVVERRKGAQRPFKSALITVFIRFPAPTEVVGTVNEGEPRPACAGLGYTIRRRVRLKRPVAGLFVFDGSRTPPKLILRPAHGASRR